MQGKMLKNALTSVILLGLLASGMPFWPEFRDQFEAKLALSSISAAEASNVYQAQLVEYPGSSLQLKSGELTNIVVRVKNIGEQTWYKDFTKQASVFLAASRSLNRTSVFYDDKTWASANRILMSETKVLPGGTASFQFNLKAPEKNDTYREYFQLVNRKLNYLGPEFFIDITVGNDSDAAVLGAATTSTSASAYTDELARQKIENYASTFVSQAQFPIVASGKQVDFYFTFKNTGQVSWKKTGPQHISLVASSPDERQSRFLSVQEIPLSVDEVKVGETATFSFTLDTKNVPANVYREYFALKVDGLEIIGTSRGTYLDIKVGESPYTFADLDAAPASTWAGRQKEIWIDLGAQKLYMLEDGEILASMITSTGRPGMETPSGDFMIKSKEKNHWSNTYKLWMPYAMSFTSVGHYLHALPRWPSGYEEGRDHLGRRVSHGCVRVAEPELLFNWASVGTKIKIRKNYEALTTPK